MKEFGRARVALWLAVLAEVALLLQMSGGISEARPEVVVEEEEVDDFVQINSHLSDPKRTRISKHRIKTPLPPPPAACLGVWLWVQGQLHKVRAFRWSHARRLAQP